MVAGTGTDLRAFTQRVRRHVVEMVYGAQSGHIGGSMSSTEILAVLYGAAMRTDPARPDWADRDRLVVSKGHAAAIVYAVLAEQGFIDKAELATYAQNGSRLAGHVTKTVPGVELSTGSLGHGLPVAAGMALAAKRAKADWRAFCIVSDGELDEGSNWEAIQFAQHARLEQLVTIVDYNEIQSFGSVAEVSDLHPLADKFRAFNWGVHEIDGHHHGALLAALTAPPVLPTRPTVVICHTVKGKGVSFMEDKLAWHYKNPDDDQVIAALAELGEA